MTNVKNGMNSTNDIRGVGHQAIYTRLMTDNQEFSPISQKI
jgi:hypothetical protein